MTCEIAGRGPGRWFVCTDEQERPQPCDICRTREHTRLCDGAPPRRGRRATCDTRLCDACTHEAATALPSVPREAMDVYREHVVGPEADAAIRELARMHPTDRETVDLCPRCAASEPQWREIRPGLLAADLPDGGRATCVRRHDGKWEWRVEYGGIAGNPEHAMRAAEARGRKG